MGNKTLIRGTIIVLVSILLFTIVMMVLIGENGLIRKEIDKYKESHVEEIKEKEKEKEKEKKAFDYNVNMCYNG